MAKARIVKLVMDRRRLMIESWAVWHWVHRFGMTMSGELKAWEATQVVPGERKKASLEGQMLLVCIGVH